MGRADAGEAVVGRREGRGVGVGDEARDNGGATLRRFAQLVDDVGVGGGCGGVVRHGGGGSERKEGWMGRWVVGREGRGGGCKSEKGSEGGEVLELCIHGYVPYASQRGELPMAILRGLV